MYYTIVYAASDHTARVGVKHHSINQSSKWAIYKSYLFLSDLSKITV